MWSRGKKDESLVRQTLRGDSSAFGVLVQRYLPAVRAQAYARVRTTADAEDIAQDAFLYAYEKLDTLREPKKFGAWLLGIGRHCAARICERRMRDAAYAEQAPHEESVEPQIERRELLQQLRAEIDRLDDATREAVLLHYFAGRTSRQIAAAMDTTPAAVRKRLQRARAVLSERLLRDAAREHDESHTRNRIMGVIATLPTDWKTPTTTAAAGTIASGISGGTVMKLVGLTAVIAIVGAGFFAYFESSPAPAAAVSPEISPAAEPETTEEPAKPSPVVLAAAEPVTVASTPEEPSEPTTWQCPIRGIVKTLAGEAVEGASVVVYLRGVGPEVNQEGILASARAATDENGFFVVVISRDLGSPHVAEMRVEKGSAFGYTRALLPTAYRNDLWKVELAETTTVSGRTSDAQGQPIAGAIVTPFQCQPEGRPGGIFVGSYAQTTSAEDGTFSLDKIWKGTWEVSVEAAGYESMKLESMLTSSSMVLVTMHTSSPDSSKEPEADSSSGAIRGRVVDAATREGIADVPVAARGSKYVGNSVTEDDGAFVIPELPADTYTLVHQWAASVPPPGLDTEGTKVTVGQEDVSGFVLQIDRSISVHGIVAQENGTPMPGTFVKIISDDLLQGEQYSLDFPAVWTDHTGCFTAYLRANTSNLYLQATSPGWASVYVGPIEVDQDGLSGIVLTVEPEATITGKWVNAAGHAGPATARLEGRQYGIAKRLAYHLNGGNGIVTTIGIGDPFYVGNLIGDTYTITYWEGNSLEPNGPVFTRTVTLNPGEALHDLVLQPTPGSVCTASGTVTFAGQPAAQAHVWLFNGSDTTPGADGVYTCTSIHPGESNVEAKMLLRNDGLEQIRALLVPVILEMNRTVHQDMAIGTGTCAIEGTVLTNGKPVADVRIRTVVNWADGAQESITATTNRQGRYRISGLPEGVFTLEIRSQDNSPIAINEDVGVQVAGAGVTRTDFTYGTGSLSVQVRGMQTRETGRFIILPAQVDVTEITPELLRDLEAKALFEKQFTEDGEIGVEVPSGVYTIVVGAFDNEQPDIESSLATLRWNSAFAEVAEGLETAVELTLE